MIDLSQLPAGTPVWVVISLVVLGAILTFSERAAKLKGPFGALARWWSTQQEQAIEKAARVDAQIEKAAERRYGARMDDMKRELDQLRKDLEAERADRKREREATVREHREEIEKVRVDRDLGFAWSEHLLAWWRSQAMWLASQGVELPPPPLPTFAQFRAQWLDARR